MASHLESLIHEYLEWRGYLVRRNTKVGRLKHGGWSMELDLIAFHPVSKDLVHYEPSIDAHSWAKREQRFKKKFDAGRKYLFSEIFPWLPPDTPLRQIAVLVNRPATRQILSGGTIVGLDELVTEIRAEVAKCGLMSSNAIPETFPLLRTIQLTQVGYYRAP